MSDELEKISTRLTTWIGTPASILVHTILFAAIFGLRFVGITLDDILLILTTAVSLEAIYLAIFIQMTVNRHSEDLAEVGEDIEDIQEEVEDLGEDVEEISEDVEEISEDIEKIQEEQTEDDTDEAKTQAALAGIQSGLEKLLAEVETLKQRTNTTGHPSLFAAPTEPATPAVAELGPIAEHEKDPRNVVQRLIDRLTPGHHTSETPPTGTPSEDGSSTRLS